MRLYLDENVPVILASLLSAHGVDCLTARQAGNLSLSDAEQLVFTGMSDVSSSPSTVETFLNSPSTGTWLVGHIPESSFPKSLHSQNSFAVSDTC
jgi:hypothetical protein